MNKKEYKDYLKSDWWVLFSRKVKKERGECEKCKTNKWLNVHHLTYINLGKEKDEDVLVLCRFCHRSIHGIKVKNRYKNKKLNLCARCGKNKISKECVPLCKFCYIKKQKYKAERKFRKFKKRLSMGNNARCFNLQRKETVFDLPLEEKIKRIKERNFNFLK